MDLGKAFSYPFEDKLWASKLGIGMAVSIVPILNFAWLGYMIEIIRRLTRGESEALPGWDDFGKKFMDGLILFLVGLVYSLPAIILVVIPVLLLIPASITTNGNMQNIGNAIMTAGGIVVLCLSCLIILYALALSIIYPAIFIEYARKGTFASCFQFKTIFAEIGKNAGAFFTAWGIYLGTAIAASIAGGIVGTVLGWVPCIGQIIAFVVGVALGVYTSLVFAHLFGQFSTTDSALPPAATS